MPDGADQPAGDERLGESARALAVGGERLLDQGVDAGLGEREADLLVVGRRDRHDAVVEADGEDLLDGPVQVEPARDLVRVA